MILAHAWISLSGISASRFANPMHHQYLDQVYKVVLF